MLHILTGPAGSGKSEWCLNQIGRLAESGKNTVIIVPEQSSYVMERAVTLRLPARLRPRCEMRSFRSLCSDVFAECGGMARRLVDDAARASIARRAVAKLSDSIVCFRRHRRDISFFSLCVSLIEECKNAGVSPEDLLRVLEQSPSELSRARMREFALIYSQYEELLGSRYVDTASQISQAAALGEHCSFLTGKTFLLDGYTGFTTPQLSMISCLLKNGNDVVVTLCLDRLDETRKDVFSVVRGCGRTLRQIAAGLGIPCRITSLDGVPRFSTKGTANLESFLRVGKPADDSADGVYMIAGDDRYQEISMVADEIRLLVRDRGYVYRDIIVISRDPEKYRTAIERTFGRYEIPMYSDSKRNMLFSPVSIFILSAIDIAVSLTTDKLFSLLKTSLCDISDDRIGQLENYAYIWNLKSPDWKKPFTRSVRGLETRQEPADIQQLEQLESARVQILEWIAPLLKRTRDAGALIKNVYQVMRSSGLLDTVAVSSEVVQSEASVALQMLASLFTLFDGERDGQ